LPQRLWVWRNSSVLIHFAAHIEFVIYELLQLSLEFLPAIAETSGYDVTAL
jgi:hypothetical protein